MADLMAAVVPNLSATGFGSSSVSLVAGLDVDTAMWFAQTAWTTFHAWVVSGYAEAPILMVGLAAVVLVPALTVIGFVANRVASRQSAPLPEPMRSEVANVMGLGWPSEAWITIEGEVPQRRQVAREMLSIGREDDNDVQLEHATVHRHHALLHRLDDTRVFVRDLSGGGGNGVKVNGARVVEAALRDGDRIEVGAVVLKFEARPA